MITLLRYGISSVDDLQCLHPQIHLSKWIAFLEKNEALIDSECEVYGIRARLYRQSNYSKATP
jgi:hypothetical protein